jgi:hypothetical protein
VGVFKIVSTVGVLPACNVIATIVAAWSLIAGSLEPPGRLQAATVNIKKTLNTRKDIRISRLLYLWFGPDYFKQICGPREIISRETPDRF